MYTTCLKINLVFPSFDFFHLVVLDSNLSMPIINEKSALLVLTRKRSCKESERKATPCSPSEGQWLAAVLSLRLVLSLFQREIRVLVVVLVGGVVKRYR